MSEQAEEQSAVRLMSDPACREADRQLMAHLASVGFTGADFERFERYVVAAALPVVVALIRSGRAFDKLRRLGRPRLPTANAMNALRHDQDVTLSLAGEAVSRALVRFRRQVHADPTASWGGWHPAGGASLLTWFANAALLEFADVFARWERQLTPAVHLVADLGVLEDRTATIRQRELVDELSAAIDVLSDREREVLLRFHRDGWSHRDIAPVIGTSENGSARLLSRAIAKMRIILVRRQT